MQLLTVTIQQEFDVVRARQRARQLAGLLGFDLQEQARIATAVSEIARNALTYAGGGKVTFELEGKTTPQVFLIDIQDRGPGIVALPAILNGEYQSHTGLGLGILGTRRLMNQVEIDTGPERGTTVHLKKLLPAKVPLITSQQVRHITAELAQQQFQDPFEEIRRQNQELLHTLGELRLRQDELLRLNRELEDTNRGVLSLYAELDEKAEHLRRADDLKTKFLSNMSHEFRTPVNSILALSRLLLDRTDGELNAEQEKQVTFIRKAADTLTDLINDILDIAKIEAGKITVHPNAFEVSELFSMLRGMLRPLLVSNAVSLIFDEPQAMPALYTDDNKVSQILRNFLSNALKFTERGTVRVSATLAPGGEAVIFSVADTGIGIALEDQEQIFQEFTQLEHPLQKRVKGTGLGLPLCRKLAELLGGTVAVQSTLGMGSTFFATIPFHYKTPSLSLVERDIQWEVDPNRIPVLIVEDESETQFIYEKFLKGTQFQPIPTQSIFAAQQTLLQLRPQAIVLDILLPGANTWNFLSDLKSTSITKDIPVLIISTVEDPRKGLALGADSYCIKPVARTHFLSELRRLTGQPQLPRILIIDDEEISRYVLMQFLVGFPYSIIEATNGLEGLRRAREDAPQLIFLDLSMPGLDGYQLLSHLKADPLTQDIPIIVSTAKTLNEEEKALLTAQMVMILPKAALSRETIANALRTAVDKKSNKIALL